MTKEDILKYFKDINFAYNDCTKYDSLSNMLDELGQEPKVGHWINMSISTSGDASMECSLCRCRVHNSFTQNLINYCPNCGAKMEKED